MKENVNSSEKRTRQNEGPMTGRYEGKKVQWDKLYGGLGLGREREGEGKGRGGLEYVVLTHCQREGEGKRRTR